MCPGHPADDRSGHDNTNHHRHVHRPHRSRRRRSRAGCAAPPSASPAFLACALPVVFTINISRMLLTGVEPEHRFHQATGQGLILFALWLGPLLPLVRAAWAGAGRAPPPGSSTSPSSAPASLCAAARARRRSAVPGRHHRDHAARCSGSALPLRPRLRVSVQRRPGARSARAAALAAFLTPYAIDQIALQNAATTGHHAQNPHLFDMAWLAVTLMVLAVLAGAAAGRSLARLVGRGLVPGASASPGSRSGRATTWSLLALAFGAGCSAAAAWMPPVRDPRLSRRRAAGVLGHAMAVAIDRRSAAPRPVARARGGGAVVAAAPAGVPRRRLACGAAVAAVAIVATGDLWHLAPAPQVLVDATVGVTCALIAAVMLVRRDGCRADPRRSAGCCSSRGPASGARRSDDGAGARRRPATAGRRRRRRAAARASCGCRGSCRC